MEKSHHEHKLNHSHHSQQTLRSTSNILPKNFRSLKSSSTNILHFKKFPNTDVGINITFIKIQLNIKILVRILNLTKEIILKLEDKTIAMI